MLRKGGAVSLQVLMITPSPGTTLFEGTFTSGMVIEQAGGREARPYRQRRADAGGSGRQPAVLRATRQPTSN